MKFFGKKKEAGQEEVVVKRSVFSLDEQLYSLKTKENFNFFFEIVKAFKGEDRSFLASKKDALNSWNLNDMDEKQLKKAGKKADRISILFLITFFIVAFFSAFNFKVYGFSMLSTISAALGMATCLSLSIIHSWQASVIKEDFTSFVDYTKRFKWIFSVVAAVLYVTSIQAVEAAVIDLPDFDVKLGTDLSSRLVGQIVGSPWADHGGTAMSNGLTSIMIPLLQALNTGALMFVSVFCVYIYGFGIVQIAHSGNWGDSQIFSTFWSPVRTTAAIALCAPMANGISFLQHLTLIAIAMSINFANVVTNVFIEQVNESNGLTISATMGPVVEENFGKITNAAIKGLAIQYAAMGIYNVNLTSDQVYRVQTSTTVTGQKKVTFTFTQPERTYSGSMPSITVVAASDTIVGGYASALASVVNALSPTISTFLSSDVSKRGDGTQLDVAIKEAHKAFSSALLEAYNNQINANKSSDLKQELQNMSTNMGTYGWMTAGIYPFVIARAQGEAQKLVSASVSSDDGNFMTALNSVSRVQTAEASLLASLFNQIDSKMKEVEASGAYAGMSKLGHTRTNGSGFEIIGDIIADNIDAIAPTYIVKTLKESNPVSAMFGFGSSMMDISSVLLTTWGAISGGAEGAARSGNNASGFLSQIPVVGSAIDTAEGGVKGALAGAVMIWTPIVHIVAGIIILFGFSCCYVLPAIPIIFWVRALTSWILLVCETLLGAPFWAAAHVLPEGQGFAGQHARQGYLMLLDVFLRPVLLVVGAIMAMLLVQVFCAVLAEILGMWAVSTNQAAGYKIAGIIFTAFVIIYLTYESIKTIYMQALCGFHEQVLKWCGNFMGGRSGGSEGSQNVTQTTSITQQTLTKGMAGAVNKGGALAAEASKKAINLNKG